MITVFKKRPGDGTSIKAEDYACSLAGTKYYIATLNAITEEDKARVEKCRNRRDGKDFVTIEQSSAIVKAIDKIKWMESLLGASEGKKVALIESLPNLAVNEVIEEDIPAKDIVNKVLFGLAFLKEYFDDIVIVTDDAPDAISYGGAEFIEDKKEVYVQVMRELNAAVNSYAEQIF